MPHFEECYYVFGAPLWRQEASACPWGCANVKWADWAAWDDDDRELTRRILQAWTDFAKTWCV